MSSGLLFGFWEITTSIFKLLSDITDKTHNGFIKIITFIYRENNPLLQLAPVVSLLSSDTFPVQLRQEVHR